MILGISELHKLVAEKKLVEGLCEREMKSPEGAGFDLRLGEVYELSGDGFLGIEDRKTPSARRVAEYDKDNRSSFIFNPGKYYLIKTIEKVNTPQDLLILFRPRTTIFRSGLMIFTGNASPGYCGELTFGMANLGQGQIEIELGARVVHAMFYRIEGETNQYRGQWQGGRVATEGKETQI
jgi:deoxycytidine triphosphate deaminase